jgi:transcriptional regulator with XRE-family HTH domain
MEGDAVPTLQARAVRRAAEITGEDSFAFRLGVTRERLLLWMNGLVTPPTEVFLAAADVLGDHALDELKRPADGPGPDRDAV